MLVPDVSLCLSLLVREHCGVTKHMQCHAKTVSE